MHNLLLAIFVVHVAALSLYVAPFIPALTAAVTGLETPGWLKVGITAVFSVASTLITTAIEQNHDLIVSWATFGRIAMAFGTSMAAYVFLRKPVYEPIANATSNVVLIGRRTGKSPTRSQRSQRAA